MQYVRVDEELRAEIRGYVIEHLVEWSAEARSLSGAGQDAGPSSEAQADRRLEGLRTETNQNFKDLRTLTNERFAQAERRDEGLRTEMTEYFREQRADMNRQFQDQKADTNRQFEQVDKRFNHMFRFIGLAIVFLGAMGSIYKFLLP